jgi:hypothetical protein
MYYYQDVSSDNDDDDDDILDILAEQTEMDLEKSFEVISDFDIKHLDSNADNVND